MSEGKKSVETELKLVLDGPDAEPAIIEKIRGLGYKIKKLDPVRNVDIYLDTFDWSLMKKKLALRYRIANGRAMYTIKGMGAIEDGIARRMETEVLLDKPAKVPGHIESKQIRNLVEEIIFPRKLVEHIQVRTDRKRYRIVTPEKAKMELAFDCSGFSLRGLHNKRRTHSLYELEAELLDGQSQALNSLSSALSSAFGYQPSAASKLEVAVERLKVAIPSKKTPEKYLVGPDDRLDAAVRKILAFQLNRFHEQLMGIDRDIDTEFVHQARVATRRMRSALRLFREALPPGVCAYLAVELQWLGGMLGAVRDLDVFLLNLSKFTEQIERFPMKKKKILVGWIEERRRSSLSALREALGSPRLINFERRITVFLNGPLPLRPRAPLALKLVRDVAPPLIRGKLNAVIEQGRKVLENPKIKQFHRLRIEMKRLRYACEFMAPAYRGALDPFIERTVEIQDCLGDIQDTVFARELMDSVFDDWKDRLVSPDLVFILGEIYQLQSGFAHERMGRFGKIWERFTSGEITDKLSEILPVMKTD